MTTSPTIGKLAEALAKAQSELKPAIKDSENPYFKSNYADLASVSKAAFPVLSKHGLSVSQIAEDEGHITTVLMHTSGEWVCGTLKLKPVKSDPQGIGSAITYARRYALASICGLATEDDDGNAATHPDKKSAPANPGRNSEPEAKAAVEKGASESDTQIPPSEPQSIKVTGAEVAQAIERTEVKPVTDEQAKVIDGLNDAVLNAQTVDELRTIYDQLTVAHKRGDVRRDIFDAIKGRLTAKKKELTQKQKEAA